MGAGGEHVGAVAAAAAAAAAAEGNQEVVVGGGGDLTRVVPWECAWPGCGKFMETGATHKFVVGHIRQHREARDEEQSRLAAREAARAMERQVKGPSCQKKNNGYKDMAAGQRAVGFIGNGGRNKGVRQT